jgi:hypothetical protein
VGELEKLSIIEKVCLASKDEAVIKRVLCEKWAI